MQPFITALSQRVDYAGPTCGWLSARLQYLQCINNLQSWIKPSIYLRIKASNASRKFKYIMFHKTNSSHKWPTKLASLQGKSEPVSEDLSLLWPSGTIWWCRSRSSLVHLLHIWLSELSLCDHKDIFVEFGQILDFSILSHCGQVMLCGERHLSQHWSR